MSGRGSMTGRGGIRKYYSCGKPGHFANNCPDKDERQNPQVGYFVGSVTLNKYTTIFKEESSWSNKNSSRSQNEEMDYNVPDSFYDDSYPQERTEVSMTNTMAQN